MADIELVIKIPEETYEYWKEHKHEYILAEAIANGTPLPKGHGRLIDADICLNKAWQNFYKQEDDHRHLNDYDIMRDQYYEQSGFECCQQTIVNSPTVEAIPKADYENRLKTDMVAILTEINEHWDNDPSYIEGLHDSEMVIQQKIDNLKENKARGKTNKH